MPDFLQTHPELAPIRTQFLARRYGHALLVHQLFEGLVLRFVGGGCRHLPGGVVLGSSAASSRWFGRPCASCSTSQHRSNAGPVVPAWVLPRSIHWFAAPYLGLRSKTHIRGLVARPDKIAGLLVARFVATKASTRCPLICFSAEAGLNASPSWVSWHADSRHRFAGPCDVSWTALRWFAGSLAAANASWPFNTQIWDGSGLLHSMTVVGHMLLRRWFAGRRLLLGMVQLVRALLSDNLVLGNGVIGGTRTVLTMPFAKSAPTHEHTSIAKRIANTSNSTMALPRQCMKRPQWHEHRFQTLNSTMAPATTWPKIRRLEETTNTNVVSTTLLTNNV